MCANSVMRVRRPPLTLFTVIGNYRWWRHQAAREPAFDGSKQVFAQAIGSHSGFAGLNSKLDRLVRQRCAPVWSLEMAARVADTTRAVGGSSVEFLVASFSTESTWTTGFLLAERERDHWLIQPEGPSGEDCGAVIQHLILPGSELLP